MRIDIPAESLEPLATAVDIRLRHLLEEIAHADVRAFRDELKREHDALERFRARLQLALEERPRAEEAEARI